MQFDIGLIYIVLNLKPNEIISIINPPIAAQNY